MKYIKIYEHPDDNDFKQNADTLYWNSFKNSKCYILYLIDQQSKSLKKKIIGKLDEFHLNHVNILNSINVKLDNKANFWFCNSVFDNNIYAQPLINSYVKFYFLKYLIKKKNIKKIILFSKDRKLEKKFKKFSDICKIDIDIKKKGYVKNQLSFKNFFNPTLLAIPIFLIFLLKRIKIFRMPLMNLDEKNNNKNLFVNYLMEPKTENNNFKSLYWGDLDIKMQANKTKRTWLHIYLPEANLKLNTVKNFLIEQNKNMISSHYILDKYFNQKTFFKIIFLWIKIILNKRKINNLLSNKYKNNFLYFLFKNDLNENICGYKFLLNAYYFFLFKNFFKKKGNFKKCFYLFENQSWERSLNYNFDANNKTGKKYAVVHSSIRFWDFRYFKMRKLGQIPILKKFFCNKKDKIIVSSKIFSNILKNNFFNKENIIFAEALRFSNSKVNYRIKSNSNYRKLKKIVLIGDYDTKINKRMEFIASKLLRKKNIKIICKSHPLNDFDAKIFVSRNIIKTNENIFTLSKKYDHFLVSNTTTASLELYSLGKNVMTLIDDELINFSPLYNHNSYDSFVYKIDQIYEKIKHNHKKTKVYKLFLSNNNLINWMKYINKE